MELQTLEIIKNIAVKIYIYEGGKYAMPEKICGKVKRAEYKACKKLLKECTAPFDYPDFVRDYCFLYFACEDMASGKAKSFEDAIEQYKEEVRQITEEFERQEEAKKRLAELLVQKGIL